MGGERKPVEERVYLGMAFYLMFAGFAASFLYDLVSSQGVFGIYESKIILILVFGFIGLVGGQAINRKYLADKPRTGEKRRETLWLYGIGMFVALSVYNSTRAYFSVYQSAIQEQSAILIISAGPMEEAFFRLFLASMLFRAFLRVLRNIHFIKSDKTAVILAMLLTCIIVSLVFVQFHAGVLEITDPRTFEFLFVNSIGYTFVYLKTGDPVPSATAHMMHNAWVVFF
jgi:membrane protease YdiL (CAAX protease family)